MSLVFLAVFYLVVAEVQWVTVHAPDGHAIEVNPKEISSIRDRSESEGHFHRDVACVLSMTNGKFIAVIEPCKAIVEMIEGAKQEH
jgi:hypothetical protein